MSPFVERYKHHVKNGFSNMQAFGIVASAIAVSGTIEDLKEVDRVLQVDLRKNVSKILEENKNERITTAI